MTEKHSPLLSCPLCGVGHEMLLTGFYYGHSVKQCEPEKRDAVMCLGCGVRAPLKSWNTRSVNGLPEAIAALEDLLEMPAACATDEEVTNNIIRRNRAVAVLTKLKG